VFIQSSLDGRFYPLAIVPEAVMNMDAQIPVFSYFGYRRSSGLAVMYSK
jgi:hypothetical protein